jgi:DUF1009 family protein
MSVALIAGEGALPEVIAERLALKGEKPVVYALREDCEGLAANALEIVPLFRAEIAATLADMASRGVKGVILAGLAPKTMMYRPEMMDSMAREFVEALSERDDHSLLGGLVSLVERAGFEVLGYRDLLGDMLASDGVLAGRPPTEDESGDVAYGVKIASVLLPLSFGQSVVVSRKSVVAVEAMEGTDATIVRAGSLCRSGVVVKMMKHGQDERYDIPVVGPQTLCLMAKTRLSCLALHSGRTLVLSPEEFRRIALDRDISVVGVGS